MGFRYKTTYDEDRNAFFNAIAPLGFTHDTHSPRLARGLVTITSGFYPADCRPP